MGWRRRVDGRPRVGPGRSGPARRLRPLVLASLAGLGLVLPGPPPVLPGGTVHRPAGRMEAGVEAYARRADRAAQRELEAWAHARRPPWGELRAAGRFLAGWIARSAGELNLASGHFAAVRAAGGPLGPLAAFLEAEVDQRRGRGAVAARECERVRAAWNDPAIEERCRWIEARAWLDAGRPAQALEALAALEALGVDPSRREILALLRARAEALRRPRLAAALLQDLVLDHRYPTTAMQAERELARLARRGVHAPPPDPLEAAMRRAVSLREERRRDAAWAAWQALLAEHGDDPRVAAWAEREARAFHLRTRRFVVWAHHLAGTGSVEEDPRLAWEVFRLLVRGGAWAEAAHLGDAALAAFPDHRRWRGAHGEVAEAWEWAGDLARARELWLATRRAEGVRRAAFCAWLAGEPEVAAAEFEGRLVGAPDDRMARYWLARSLEALGEREAAREHLERLVATGPWDWYGVLAAGRLARAAGRRGVSDVGFPLQRPRPAAAAGRLPGVPSPIPAPPAPSGWLGLQPGPPIHWDAWMRLDAEPVLHLQRGGPAAPFGEAPRWRPLPDHRWDNPLFERERGERVLARLAEAWAGRWPEAAALPLLARVGLDEVAGPLFESFVDRARRAGSRSWARRLGLDRGDLLAAALVAGDHRDTARWSTALVRALSGGPRKRDALRLHYPVAFPRSVERWSRRHDLDPLLVLALMRQESLYRVAARSRSGASGLVQVIPPTGARIAEELGLQRFDPADLEEPDTVVRFGTWYLARLVERFAGAWPVAVAAYNAGPVNVSTWMKGARHVDLDAWVERIPIAETRTYVQRVVGHYAAYRYAVRGEPPGTLLLPRRPGADRREVVDY